MEQELVEIIEKRLLYEKVAQFRGTARVRFENLDFVHGEPNEKSVNYLEDKFKKQGILRLEPKHRIPAIIDAKVLDEALGASSNISSDSLLDNPKDEPPELMLPSGLRIECLQGLHRVEAGKRILPPGGWWWAIDLYTNDAGSDLRTALSEEYSDSVNFSDGEIYLKIQECRYNANRQLGTIFSEKSLWARLSRDKRKDLNRILNHETLSADFDALRVFPGLWVGFRIEHKFMSMKCDEEILHYLKHIFNFWSAIVGGKKELMRHINPATVEEMQLRAPGASSDDLLALEEPFRQGKLFPGIEDETERQAIWMRLQRITFLIPSLYTLFEDIRYLKAPAKIMRQLFPKSSSTTFKAMTELFAGSIQNDNTYLVQESETSFRKENGQRVEQIEFGYRSVWLYAWRHWTELVPECPLKEENEPTPKPQKPNIRKWYELAALAAKHGFQSDQISHYTSLSPDREIAIETLKTARDSAYFTYDKSALEDYLSGVPLMFDRIATPRSRSLVSPPLLVDGSGEGLERRCGRVFSRAYENDREHLFLDTVCRPRGGDGKAISSFFVRASVYFAFFGDKFKSGVSVDTPNPTNEATQLTESEATASVEAGPTSLNGAIPEQPLSSIVVARPPEVIVMDHEDGQELESSTAMVLASSSEDEAMAESIAGYASVPARISIKNWENGALVDQERPLNRDKDEVTRMMRKKEHANFRLFDIFGRALTHKNCFEAVERNGTWTIVLARADQIDINRQLLTATANYVAQAEEGRPRRRLQRRRLRTENEQK